MKTITRCTRCVMDDSSDNTIRFDENGACSYCTEALATAKRIYFPGEAGKVKIDGMKAKIARNNRSDEYDCLMGISGGLDSSYLAYLGAVVWGLRIYAVHVDDSFDTEVSRRNIERLSKLPNLHLEIIKPDYKQYMELTRAYVYANVPNLAIPQDNITLACLMKAAREKKIHAFLSGTNWALEGILQKGNSYTSQDIRNIKDIFKRYGRGKIDKLHFFPDYLTDFYSSVYNIKTYTPLDYVEYNREKALKELYDYCGFEYYGGKHLENSLTAFIQLYWFYKKFNVDKRKSHLSSMIVSGQMTRDEALAQLAKPMYDEDEMKREISDVLKELDISPDEFEKIMASPARQHTDYKTSSYAKNKRAVLTFLSGIKHKLDRKDK